MKTLGHYIVSGRKKHSKARLALEHTKGENYGKTTKPSRVRGES
jgi:hypothetical protein